MCAYLDMYLPYFYQIFCTLYYIFVKASALGSSKTPALQYYMYGIQIPTLHNRHKQLFPEKNTRYFKVIILQACRPIKPL